LVVTDGKEPSIPSPGKDSTAADTVAITIVSNSAPVANAGSDLTRDENTRVTLDGSLSFDPDRADTISYLWQQTSGPAVTLDDPSSATPSFQAPFVDAGGATLTFQLVVRDNDPVNPLSSAPNAVDVHVLNTDDPPNCSLGQASPSRLWPPNRQLVPVQIVGITDDQTAASQLTIRVVAVTEDEPLSSPGGDAVIASGATVDSVLLRAVRDMPGNGRVYRVVFTASDGVEACTGSVVVEVPKDRNGTAIDDGQNYNALQP
jgi:hypothetical protein